VETSRFQLQDGDKNVGTAYLPDERPAPVPVLVVCYGGTSDQHLYPFTVELRDRATAAGMAVVTFDFYASGETAGDPRDATYGRWADNLGAVCAYVATQAWADAGRIGALGISAGSTAVLRYAITRPPLAAGIAVATFLGHYVAMPEGPAKSLIDHLDTLVAGGTVDLFDTPYGLGFFKDCIGGAPIYRLHTINCPIFFLQGGADNVFRRTDARLGYDLLRAHGLPASYREIEAGDHVLGNVPHEGADAVLAWLREIAFLR